MSLSCSRCKRDSGLTGDVSGFWTCGPCLTEKKIMEKFHAILVTLKARREIMEGKNAILIPGRILPPETTDLEAQQVADENYGIKWERRPDKVIIWCEM